MIVHLLRRGVRWLWVAGAGCLIACGEPPRPTSVEAPPCAPESEIVRLADGTEFDPASQLTWKDGWSEGAMPYAEAVAKCGEYRLPTFAEANDYYLSHTESWSVGHPEVFASDVDRQSVAYWTGERYLSYTVFNWTFDMSDGSSTAAYRYGIHADRRRLLLVRGEGGLYAPEKKFGQWGRWTLGRGRIGVLTDGTGARVRFRVAHPVVSTRDPVHVSMRFADEASTSRTLTITNAGEFLTEIPVGQKGVVPIDLEVRPIWNEGDRDRGIFVFDGEAAAE